ncbi:MAG: LysE family translocator [Bacteroidales bacterium]|nr:LysE family translocator [Bacteroidales bacterium]MCM1147725.1 LysE family translocator [Bacteroidales bacterium]MCM1206665.1 LysE family translocator [Bacillota bacterium]
MQFGIHIDLMELALKGILIGIIASAPMGPVGVLTIQRTLNKGRWYGMVTGLGAAVSDMIYALITGLGMSFVMDLITSPQNKFWLQLFGSLMLLAFGAWCFFSDPTKKIHRSGKQKGTLVQNGITGFLVTFSNPLIILLFMACFAQFAFVVPNRPVEMTFGYICVFAGALLWWYGLTWLIDMVREKFSDSSILLINRIIGSVVVIFSLVMFIGTVFNLYTFSYW